jgi:hypothetical protein
MGNEVLIAFEFVSTVLAMVLVYLFSKAFRLTRAVYVVGLPVGFSFLASSYALFGLSYLYEGDVTVSEQLLWLRLITLGFGYAFIAFSYYFSSRTEEVTKNSLYMISSASVITLLLFSIVAFLSPPFLKIPSAKVADECFRVGNLVLLMYVLYHLVQRLESSHQQVSGMWAPTAFFLMWLGQYSGLIWGIDGSQSALVFGHAARLASLIVFLRVYYSSGRAHNEGGKT